MHPSVVKLEDHNNISLLIIHAIMGPEKKATVFGPQLKLEPQQIRVISR
jgi:hypothetical protein